MRLSVRHTLTLTIGPAARATEHVLLTPLQTAQQRVERWSIDMPGIDAAALFWDGYGNRAHLVTQARPVSTIEIVAMGTVETTDKAGVLGRLDHDPAPGIFLRPSEAAKAQADLIDGLAGEGGRIPLLHALMDRVHLRAGQQSQAQAPAVQEQTQGGGWSVEDSTHAFIGSARALDIPARYVTGYLLDDGAARFHCWAEAWDERLGWIGFDPTLNVCPAHNHVRLASGLDAASAAAVRSIPMASGPWAQRVDITGDQEPSA